MNAHLHPCLAAALAPFAPPQSVVHQIVADAALQADLDYLHLKQSGELERRREAQALRLQIEQPFRGVKP